MGTSKTKTAAAFKCKACGGTEFELSGDAADASTVRCKSCHAEASADLKSAAKRSVGKRVQQDTKQLFRDLPGTKGG